MTQVQLKSLYGPVAEDMILVEDLLEIPFDGAFGQAELFADLPVQQPGARER